MKLQNKTAIITGGAKWIWRAISLDLLKSGINVVINYFWDEKNVENFKKELNNFSWKFLFVKADVSKIKEVEKIFKKAKANFWVVDILINNAWVFTFEDLNLEERFKKVFEINFFSQVYMTNFFEKQFSGDLWKIVNISSMYSINPFPVLGWTRCPEYVCSKSVIDMYSKLCAKNFDWKILVNTVNPWSVLTQMWEWEDKDYVEKRAVEPMIKRFIKPEEISDAVLFLLKNDAMNWGSIVVDWGNILK